MKKVIIDTNALISFVTDRNPPQQEKVARVFDNAANLRTLIFCPQNVLTEFIYVMDKIYGFERKKIADMAADFLATPGIEILHEVNFETVLDVWPGTMSDFGDAVIVSLAKTIKDGSVLTFDRNLRTALKKLNISVVPI